MSEYKTVRVRFARVVVCGATFTVPADTTKEQAERLALEHDMNGDFNFTVNYRNPGMVETDHVADEDNIWNVTVEGESNAAKDDDDGGDA